MLGNAAAETPTPRHQPPFMLGRRVRMKSLRSRRVSVGSVFLGPFTVISAITFAAAAT